MKIQMHNEISNAIDLDRDLELIWRWLRWIQKKEIEEMTKKSWKIKYFHFVWSCENLAWLCEMDQNEFLLQTKGKPQGWFRMIMWNAPERRKLLLLHFLVRTIKRNCWISCEMTILLLNFRFLREEASVRPLRWCQVSTWPWPINKNLIFSFRGLLDISNCRIF